MLNRRFKLLSTHLISAAIFLAVSTLSAAAEERGVLEFAIGDGDSNALPCRIHLSNDQGDPVRDPRQPFWYDHFSCNGSARLEVPIGNYSWEIERGPEYSRLAGTTGVTPGATSRATAKLVRIADMKEEGWLSGDLHVHRPVSEIKQLMRSEDLHFAPVIGWWNTPAPQATVVNQTEFRFDSDRIYCTHAGEDEREGGALLYFGLKRQLDLSVQSREFPSPMHFVQRARDQNERVWIDIEKPFWWDTPTWLASGQANSIGIANNHMNRSGMFASEAWGRPRDAVRLPAPKGNGFWTQEIYYHILNSGIRIPPSAGSASGVLKNPVGYNRVYVQLGDTPFTRDNWFASLRSGRCFVTNGPLLRVTANEQWPGDTFTLEQGSLSVQLKMRLTSNDPISMVEVIHNGETVKQIPCRNQSDQQLTATLQVSQPGWIVVRAIADIDDTFRFASTAPWYVVKKDQEPRVSRQSAQFFLDWVNERIETVNNNVSNGAHRDSVLKWHVAARQFWMQRRENANAE